MNTNYHDELMNMGDMSDLDNQILAQAGEEDLVERAQEQKDKSAALKAPWMQEVKEHWYIYALLALSFLLTETLAFYLGTAPTIINEAGEQYVQFHTDFGHMATAIVYMLVLPFVTEVGFDRAWKKYAKRETGNFNQQWSMLAAVVVSIVSWVGTAAAGGYVILSTLGSVGFLEIPPQVQKWLIWALAVLLPFFALMHAIYKGSSKAEKNRRFVEEQEQTAELNDQMRMKQIERAGKRAIRAAAIRSYERAVAMGLLSQAEADAAMSQGISLADLERRMRRDLTGEGKIGDTSGLNQRALPAPGPQSSLNKQQTGMDDQAFQSWEEVNRRLEEVKQDLLRAKTLLDRGTQPDPTEAVRSNGREARS